MYDYRPGAGYYYVCYWISEEYRGSTGGVVAVRGLSLPQETQCQRHASASPRRTGVTSAILASATATSITDGITYCHPLRTTSTPRHPANMRAAVRLLASVKPAQYLEVGAPTGLTGLFTHPSPRSTLLYHYNSTLDKLKQIPESSVYRQSTEALTKHRLSIIEQTKPAGWEQWQDKLRGQLADDPDLLSIKQLSNGTVAHLPQQQEVDERTREAEWDGEEVASFPEGIRSAKERRPHIQQMKGDAKYKPERTISPVKFDPEPQYTIDEYVL